MPPTDAVATLAADAQLLRRLGETLTPRGVAPTAGEAVALQLASTGSPDAEMPLSGLHVGYTAVAPLSTAALFQHVTETCGETVAVRGCEAATRAHAVGTAATATPGPQLDPDVRLMVYDAIGHATDDLHATIVRAINSGVVAVTTNSEYTTQSPAGVIAVGQTRASADEDPFDPQITSCLDCIVTLNPPDETVDVAAAEASVSDAPATDVTPVPTPLLNEYLTAVREITPTVTSAAREQWTQYKTAQPADTWKGWIPIGSLSATETVPKIAAALTRLELADTVTAAHTTTAIEWLERVTSHATDTASSHDESAQQ